MSTSKSNGHMKNPDQQVSSIEAELEQFLSMSNSSNGKSRREEENDLDRSSGSKKDAKDKASRNRKIKYNRSNDGPALSGQRVSRHLEDDNKSCRSKKSSSGMSRTERHCRRSRSKDPSILDENPIPKDSRSSLASYDSADDIDPNSKRSTKSHGSGRTRESRKISYRSGDATEGIDEKIRDDKSVLSKNTNGSSLSRSSHGKKSIQSRQTERSATLSPNGRSSPEERSGLSRSRHKKIHYRKVDASEPAQERTRDSHSVQSKNSKRMNSGLSTKKADKRYEFDDWSSGDEDDDEEEIEIGLNDGGGENCTPSPEGRERGVRRRFSNRDPTEQRERRTPGARRKVPRSMSLGSGSNLNFGGRRPPRRMSSAVTQDMILGDPSRRAPPGRSKSSDLQFMTSRLILDSSRKAPPKSKSDDFADFLRQRGMETPPRRLSHRRASLDLSKDMESEEDDNPFEVTYQSNQKSSNGVRDTWDPFSADFSDDPDESVDSSEFMDRRGKLTATKSGGLIQASSRDTLARGKFSRREEEKIECVAKTEREKQRRADYKKSIVAATNAGRRQSMRQRQMRQSSTAETLRESVNKLEAALEAR